MSNTDRNPTTNSNTSGGSKLERQSSKRAREEDVNIEDGNDEGDPLAILESVFDKLLKNRVIREAELSLIGQTCRTLRAALLDDQDTWLYFCTAFCNPRELSQIPSSIISARGHKWVYRRLTRSRRCGAPLREPSTDLAVSLDPPKTTCDDIVLVVTIDFQGKSILSKTMTGQDLLPILNSGVVTFPLDAKLEFDDAPFYPKHDWDQVDNEITYDPGTDLGIEWANEEPQLEASILLMNVRSNEMYSVAKMSGLNYGEYASTYNETNEHGNKDYKRLTIDPDYDTRVWPIQFFGRDEEESRILPFKRTAKCFFERLINSRKDHHIRSGHRFAADNPIDGTGYWRTISGDGLRPTIEVEIALLPGKCVPARELDDGSFVKTKRIDVDHKLLFMSFDRAQVGIAINFPELTGYNRVLEVFNSEGETREVGKSGVSLLHMLDHLDWSVDD